MFNHQVDKAIGFSVCCEDGQAWRLQSLSKNNYPAASRNTAATFSELPANISSAVTLLSLVCLQRQYCLNVFSFHGYFF
jgi:hypothetical protein